MAKGFQPRRGARVEALGGVDLEVEDGEFFVLVGPTGCGKTTLLSCLAGLERPDRGEILLDGHAVTGPGEGKAVVFQDHALFPWYTVERSIAFGLEMKGMGRGDRDARVGELMELVGLKGFERHYPRELSGGMQQRVGLARALAVEPQLLLMDEPFAAVDAQTRDILQEELIRLWQRTRPTVVFITHGLLEAVRLGDRVAVISPRPGRISHILEVPLPHPRDPYSPDLAKLAGGLRAWLGQA